MQWIRIPVDDGAINALKLKWIVILAEEHRKDADLLNQACKDPVPSLYIWLREHLAACRY